jgi:hypothetical protein
MSRTAKTGRSPSSARNIPASSSTRPTSSSPLGGARRSSWTAWSARAPAPITTTRRSPFEAARPAISSRFPRRDCALSRTQRVLDPPCDLAPRCARDKTRTPFICQVPAPEIPKCGMGVALVANERDFYGMPPLATCSRRSRRGSPLTRLSRCALRPGDRDFSVAGALGHFGRRYCARHRSLLVDRSLRLPRAGRPVAIRTARARPRCASLSNDAWSSAQARSATHATRVAERETSSDPAKPFARSAAITRPTA